MARPTYKAGARLKGFAVKGEFKTNSEGVVVSEPELVITLSVPVDERIIDTMRSLAAIKTTMTAACDVTIEGMQTVMDLGAVAASQN